MKFHYSTFILAFLLILGSFGKMNAQEEVKKGNYIHKANSIFFAPINLFDPINPSFQVGYERMFYPKWALQIEGAYIIRNGLLMWIFPHDYNNRGYKLRLELKYYLKKESNYGLYTSYELFYLKNKSDVYRGFIVSDTSYNYSFEFNEGYENDPKIEYIDFYTNEKTKHGMNFKFGFKVYPGSFMLEAHVGMGFVYRINKHTNRENKNDKPEDDSFFYDQNNEGKSWILNLPLNIKVGYRF
ncbi:MAG: hypothetical protein HS119_14435 [Flavobacteriales bacterium]|nr:hypothetical protein [Flavobacteriales bacterium]